MTKRRHRRWRIAYNLLRRALFVAHKNRLSGYREMPHFPPPREVYNPIYPMNHIYARGPSSSLHFANLRRY